MATGIIKEDHSDVRNFKYFGRSPSTSILTSPQSHHKQWRNLFRRLLIPTALIPLLREDGVPVPLSLHVGTGSGPAELERNKLRHPLKSRQNLNHPLCDLADTFVVHIVFPLDILIRYIPKHSLARHQRYLPPRQDKSISRIRL